MMKDYNSQIPLISIHVPKCGGVSLKGVLEKWFKENMFFHYYDEKNEIMPRKIKTREKYSLSYKPDICIHGHFDKRRGFGVKDYYPRTKQAITFLRDPLEVHLSLFNFIHQQNKNGIYFLKGKAKSITSDIDEFLEISNPYFKNFFPDDLNSNTIEKYLDTYFVHIGIIEDYQHSLNILADKLKKPRINVPHLNISERFSTPSSSSINKFKSKCKWEYKLYNRAVLENK